MKKKILQIGNPILEKKSLPVKTFDSKVKSVIQDLLDTVLVKKDITAGLSAPQLGENLRIFVARRMDIEEEIGEELPDNKAWEVVINPVIKKCGKKTSTYWEGCLSVGEGKDGLYSPIERSDKVVIEYLDRNGKKKELECNGFFAHIVQHEIDHLNGKLFISYVDDPSKIWTSADLDKYYSEFGDYPQII